MVASGYWMAEKLEQSLVAQLEEMKELKLVDRSEQKMVAALAVPKVWY